MKTKTNVLFFSCIITAILYLFVAAPVQAATNIPASAKKWNGHSYQLYQQTMTFADAERYCESLGGHLATIASAQENKMLTDYLTGLECGGAMIGLYDSLGSNGTWSTWVTGEKVRYKNWGARQPDWAGQTICVLNTVANSYYGWEIGEWDNGWDGDYYFICEWDTVCKTDLKNASVSLSQSSYTYDRKAKKPNVTVRLKNKTLLKNKDYTLSYQNNIKIGLAQVSITGIGDYQGKISKTFKILPGQVKGLKLQSKEAGKLKTAWSRVDQAGTYQIQYSQKSNFSRHISSTAAKTQKNFTNLAAKKTYYIRVRAGKKVSGTTYYGKWSSSQKIKISDYIVPSIKLDHTSMTICTPLQKHFTLTATVTGKNKKVKWTSSDDTIASVKNGRVTVLSNDDKKEITIIAEANKKKATCHVKIINEAIVTKEISFNTLDEWISEIQKAEKLLSPINPSFKDPVSEKTLSNWNYITKKKVLNYKKIKVSYKEAGETRSYTVNCPSKIQYTLKCHIHSFRKGYGYSGYFGDGGIVVINQCSCGYRSEWTWEIPDLTEMDKSQTTATVTSSLPKINKK